MLQRLALQDNHFPEESITVAEDERTVMAKDGTTEVRENTINKAHKQSNAKPMASIIQLARNTTYGIRTAFKRAATQLLTNKKQVTFGETKTITWWSVQTQCPLHTTQEQTDTM